MKTLIRFADWWNSRKVQNFYIYDEFPAEHKEALLKMINTYLTLEEEESEAVLRMSAIGKPIVDLAYSLVDEDKREYSSRGQYWSISMGIYGEALVKMLMSANGFHYSMSQERVKLGPLVGHIDGVVDDTTVFDIKFMSYTYYNQFVSKPNDERGYLTQLSVYRKALGLPKAAFLCINKVTGQCRVVKLSQKKYVECLHEVKAKLKLLKQIHQSQNVALVEPPLPRLNKAGKYVVPDIMKYSPNVVDIYGHYELVDVEYFQQKWPSAWAKLTELGKPPW